MRVHVACLAGLLLVPAVVTGQSANPLVSQVDKLTHELTPQVVTWRRDFHQHPELGNRETRTSKVIAEELRRLGYEVRTGVAHTGVVAVLKGARPGPTVALRADMDALPVTEQGDLPFKSVAKATWNGQEVGVMHACGHDNHMAILLGAATIFARMRAELPGTIKLIFQPAEEGPPPGEQGGAELMVKEGVLDNPKVDAIFGLHVFPNAAGTIEYRPGPLMASGDAFTIRITGKQTHGAVPWGGIDPRRRADRHVPSDHRQPIGEHHRGARGRHHRRVQRRQPVQHRPRIRRAAWHGPGIQRGRAEGHPSPNS
jgi:amidohydrolase